MSVYLKCKADNATFGVEAFTSAAKPYIAMNYTTQTGTNSDQTTVSKAYIPLTTDTRVAGTKKIPVVYTTQTGVESSQTESKKLYIVQKTNVDTVTLTSFSGTYTSIGSTIDPTEKISSSASIKVTSSAEYSREWSATTRLINIDAARAYSSSGTLEDSNPNAAYTLVLTNLSETFSTSNSRYFTTYISTISTFNSSSYSFYSFAPGRGGKIIVPNIIQKDWSSYTAWYDNTFIYSGDDSLFTTIPGYISHYTNSSKTQSNSQVTTRKYVLSTCYYTCEYAYELTKSIISTITESVYSSESNVICPDRYTFTTTTL